MASTGPIRSLQAGQTSQTYTTAMPNLMHGSDLRLAPTLSPACQALSINVRQCLSKIAELGFSAVQIDATLPSLRPRELDITARRDLLATIRREGLSLAGVDFFIPAEHYSTPEHVDRAVHSATLACVLAGDLDRVPLSLNLPLQNADPAILQTLFEQADINGISVAIHDETQIEQLMQWQLREAPPHAGAGLDPAALLIRGKDPVKTTQQLAGSLRIARLSDASTGQSDGTRQIVGTGSLDIMTYRLSIDLAPQRIGPVVLDLRGLRSPIQAMQAANKAWQKAAIAY